MGAIPQQIAESEKHNLFPIFGVELYVNRMQPKVANRSCSAEFRKSLGDGSTSDRVIADGKVSILQKSFDKSCHLLAIAYNDQGYSNLVKLTSWAWIHGYYRRPRVNHEVLMQHKEGIIFTSTCANSEIAQAFFEGGDDAGYEMVEKYMAMFGEYFYLELMMLDFKKQKPYDSFLIRAHDRYHVPLMLSQDCHYCRKEQSHNQRLMLMQQKKRTLAEIQMMINSGEAEDLFELQDTNLWLKSEEELNQMWEMKFSDVIDYELYKQSKANTVKIAEFAKGVQIDRGTKLPKIPDADLALWEEIKKGYINRGCPRTTKYAKRIKEEYELIIEKGFSSYFLIQKMMVDEARSRGPDILGFGDGSEAVGPGRGCLHPLTPVRLEDGTVRAIGKIKVGDRVYTVDGSSREVQKTMIYPLNEESLLNIKTYYGDHFGVSLTADHKVYAERQVRTNGRDRSDLTKDARKIHEEPNGNCEWIEAGKLNVGDWCFVPIPSVLEKNCVKYDLSDFSTAFSSNVKKLTFDKDFIYHELKSKESGQNIIRNQRHWELTPEWAYVLGAFVGDGWTNKKQIGEVGFCCKKQENNLDYVRDIFERNGVHSTLIQIHDNKESDKLFVRSFCMEMLFNYFHPNYSHTAETKHVPDFILKAPLNLVERYLSGYFMVDGYEDQNKAKFETFSPVLAEQIRFLLMRLGIPSSLKIDTRQESRVDGQDIEWGDLFAKVDFVNLKPSYVINCPLDCRIGTRLDSSTRNEWKKVSDGIMLRIREISEVTGVSHVCDIQVDVNHNYLTSSFIVHNSVCGSLVAYCLRLHDVEPIIHDLRFSRFLSHARGGKQMNIRHTIKQISK